MEPRGGHGFQCIFLAVVAVHHAKNAPRRQAARGRRGEVRGAAPQLVVAEAPLRVPGQLAAVDVREVRRVRSGDVETRAGVLQGCRVAEVAAKEPRDPPAGARPAPVGKQPVALQGPLAELHAPLLRLNEGNARARRLLRQPQQAHGAQAGAEVQQPPRAGREARGQVRHEEVVPVETVPILELVDLPASAQAIQHHRPSLKFRSSGQFAAS